MPNQYYASEYQTRGNWGLPRVPVAVLLLRLLLDLRLEDAEGAVFSDAFAGSAEMLTSTVSFEECPAPAHGIPYSGLDMATVDLPFLLERGGTGG